MDNGGIEKKRQWKQIWQLTSGIYFETPNDVVLEKLREVSDELLNGLQKKKNITQTTTTTDPKSAKVTAKEEEESIRKNCPKKLLPFIEKLKECLDLDMIDAWSLFCYYLMNEYRGSINTITTYLSTSTNMLTFLMNLWECHTMERMIKLKIVKNLFSFYKSPSHPYSNEYKEILEHQLNITELRKSYIDQLKELICEQQNYHLQMMIGNNGDSSSLMTSTTNAASSQSFRGSIPSSLRNHLTIHSDFMQQPQIIQAHAERKCREIIEILQILILIVNYNGILPSEFETIFGLFKLHSFGRQESNLNNNDSNNSSVLEELKLKIMYNEIALFLKCIDITQSGNTEWINNIKKLLDHHIVNGGHHLNIEHGPILFGWMAFQLKTLNLSGGEQEQEHDDEQFLKCRQMAIKSVQLHVFTTLHKMLTHSMFKNQNIVSKIVRRSIYNHLSFVCETFDGDGALARHPGIYDLLCELLTSTALAKEFCGKDDFGVHSLFNTAIENFPIDFISLSMFAHSISSTGILQYRKYIRDRLENLPIYSEYYNPENIQLQLTSTATAMTSSNENETENELMLMSDYQPFDKINWIIPAGTIVLIKDSQIDLLSVVKNYQQQQQSSSNNHHHNTNSTIHFRTSVNYFTVLRNEINQMFCDTLKYTEINVSRKLRILAGLKYITNELHFIENPNDITNEMVHPIEMIIDILQKFKLQKQPPIDLLIQCFKICTELLPLFECEIFQRIIALQILPNIHNNNYHYNNNNHAMMMDYRSLAQGVHFDSSLIGSYLINFEKNTGTYDFLMSYLKFLKSYSKLSLQNVNAVELPGLVFILREIFPHMHSWRFVCEQNRQQIYIQILEYFFDILQLPAEQLRNDKPRTILRNVCVYSLLQLDNGMILLRFIAMGNSHLENRMQSELNWMIASQSGLNLIIQLSMTILMQILRLRNCISIDGDLPKIGPNQEKHQHKSSHNNNSYNNNNNNNENQMCVLSPIETIIYTQPKQWDTLRIIPVVTSYMDNIFNRRLPILSCRLLRRFAIEFQMSLLACLDMEPDQLRLIFLQRLENHLEIDALKIAIIEFVDSCIVKQPGLTQAFFKINYAVDEKRLWGRLIRASHKKTYQLTDGILMYMSEYLDVILNEPKTIVSPILSGIMSLFHTLWKNNMQSLVQKLIEKNNFWQSLTNILFFNDSRDINNNIRAYSQLFNIISIELYRTRQRDNVDDGNRQPHAITLNMDLKNAIEKFLSPEYFQKWIDNILDNIPIVNVDTSEDHHQINPAEWLCRLQSFKDLLTIIMRNIKVHNILLLNDSTKYLLNKLLKMLLKHSQLSNDYRPLIIIAELYLIVLISCDNKCAYTETIDEDRQLIENIHLLLNSLTIDYAEMPERVRESILAITSKIIDLYWTTNVIQKEPQIALNFMRSISKIFCLELNEIEMMMMVVKNQNSRCDKIDNDENYNNNNNGDGGDDHDKNRINFNREISTTKKLSIILIINLLKKMLLNFLQYDNEIYPYENEILAQHLPYRIVNCLNIILPVYKTKYITVELLDLLIILAKGKCSMELMNCPIVDYLWLKLLPPIELLQQQQLIISGTSSGTGTSNTKMSATMSKARTNDAANSTNTKNNSLTANHSPNNNHHHQQEHKKMKHQQQMPTNKQMKWQTTNEWWLIYGKGIEFITTLLKKHSYRFLRDTLMFVGIHEEYLMDSVLLSKYTMDSNARCLIKSTLDFLNELARFEKEWRLEHQQSLINLMRCVQIVLNHSVSLIYRPKLLKRLMDGNENDTVTINVRGGGGGGVGGVGVTTGIVGGSRFGCITPGGNQFDGCNPVGDSIAAELIQPMNDLTEMIISSAKCLLVFSPKLLDLLTAPEFIPSDWHPLIEIQFGAPKLSVDLHQSSQLTFGIVLSAVGIFTKTLHLQHYEFDECPLNDVFKRKCNDGCDLMKNRNGRSDVGGAANAQSQENHRTQCDGTQVVDGNPAIASINLTTARNPFTKSISMTSVVVAGAGAGSNSSTVGTTAGNTGHSLALPSNEILRNLDTKLCVTALEYLLTLLASQSLLAIKDIYLSNREKQLIKRELSTEIIQFHDFVKKRLNNDGGPGGGGGGGGFTKGPLYRKKYGIRLYKNVCNTKKRSKNVDNLIVINEDDAGDDDDDDDDGNADDGNADDEDTERIGGQSTLPRLPSSRANSMRVNVMRKVHLTTKQQQQQQQQQEQLKTPTTSDNKSRFNLTTNISPIIKATPNVMGSRTNNNIIASTPMEYQQQEEGICDAIDQQPVTYHEPIEPTFTGLSDVNLVEEDYFHFLSNLFTVICQHE